MTEPDASVGHERARPRANGAGVAAALRWLATLEDESRASGAFGGMILDLIERDVDRLGEVALRRLEPTVWPTVRDDVAASLRASLGIDPPGPREPPRARLVGRHEHDGVVIERLVLEPRRGFDAPALLYLPQGSPGPVPAVVVAVGHWLGSGKSTHHVQALCTGLSRLGIAALAMDPLGQGERGPSWEAHGVPGLLPLGLSQLGLRVWELMRGIDHLTTRPEIDGERLGITGASGGGLATVFTAALDPRLRVAAAVCAVTSYARFLRDMRGLDWNGRGDLCNQVPGVIALAEMAGVCGLIAPRPLLIVNGTRDTQFTVEGARDVMERLEPLYAAEPSALRLRVVDGDHGFARPMREATYGWFHRWLGGTGDGTPIPEAGAELYPEGASHLLCLAPGTIRDPMRALRDLISDVVRLRSGAWVTERERRATPAAIEDVLGIAGEPEATGGLVAGRHIGTVAVERHVLIPEPGVSLPSILLAPVDRPGSPSQVIVLADQGKRSAEALRAMRTLVRARATVFAFDPRGTGETVPIAPGPVTLATLDGGLEAIDPSPGHHLDFETATDCLMLGRSLLGQQAQDVVAVARHLRPGAPPRAIALVAIGPLSCLRAVFAAALEPSIGPLWLECWPTSFLDIALTDGPVLSTTAYLAGVLDRFDLVDVLGELASRSVTIHRPIGAGGAAVDPRGVRRSYASAITRAERAGGELRVLGVPAHGMHARWARSWSR